MRFSKIIVPQLLILPFILLAPQALSAGLRSQSKNEIAQFIEQKLQEANDDAKSKGLNIALGFQYGAVDNIAQKLSGHFGQKTNAQPVEDNTVELYIYAVDSTGSKNVGFMEINFEIGTARFFTDETDITARYKDDSYYVFLKYMFINEAFRGKGYSGKALTVFHDFLDRLGVDYVALYIRSQMPYTGNVYSKAGYQFIGKTIAAIKAWAKAKDIVEEKAIQAFLQDSTQNLEGHVATMIRHGNKK